MEIKGVGTFAQSVKPSGKPQAPPTVDGSAGKGDLRIQSPSGRPAPDARPRVRAKDLLTEDEQRYLESLFPGATSATGTGESYAGKGRPGAVPTGALVDRKG